MKTVILDLDGTIIDTSERQYHVYLDSVTAIGSVSTGRCPEKSTFWAKKRSGKSTVEILPKSFPSSLVEEFREEWRSRIEQREYLRYDEFHQGAQDALYQLKRQDIRLLLATNRTMTENAYWQLDELGISDLFEATYVIPHDRETKSERLKREETNFPGGSVFIGDSESDIEAARRLGITSIAVESGVRSRRKLQQFSPSRIVDHLAEAVRIFTKADY
jgi:phosphoglycolate phosphatase